jgi:hypothetical protein
MVHHRERPAGALAHGAATSSDIQRVRRDFGVAELRAARVLQAEAARQRRDATRLMRAPRDARGH